MTLNRHGRYNRKERHKYWICKRLQFNIYENRKVCTNWVRRILLVDVGYDLVKTFRASKRAFNNAMVENNIQWMMKREARLHVVLNRFRAKIKDRLFISFSKKDNKIEKLWSDISKNKLFLENQVYDLSKLKNTSAKTTYTKVKRKIGKYVRKNLYKYTDYFWDLKEKYSFINYRYELYKQNKSVFNIPYKGYTFQKSSKILGKDSKARDTYGFEMSMRDRIYFRLYILKFLEKLYKNSISLNGFKMEMLKISNKRISNNFNLYKILVFLINRFTFNRLKYVIGLLYKYIAYDYRYLYLFKRRNFSELIYKKYRYERDALVRQYRRILVEPRQLFWLPLWFSASSKSTHLEILIRLSSINRLTTPYIQFEKYKPTFYDDLRSRLYIKEMPSNYNRKFFKWSYLYHIRDKLLLSKNVKYFYHLEQYRRMLLRHIFQLNYPHNAYVLSMFHVYFDVIDDINCNVAVPMTYFKVRSSKYLGALSGRKKYKLKSYFVSDYRNRIYWLNSATYLPTFIMDYTRYIAIFSDLKNRFLMYSTQQSFDKFYNLHTINYKLEDRIYYSDHWAHDGFIYFNKVYTMKNLSDLFLMNTDMSLHLKLHLNYYMLYNLVVRHKFEKEEEVISYDKISKLKHLLRYYYNTTMFLERTPSYEDKDIDEFYENFYNPNVFMTVFTYFLSIYNNFGLSKHEFLKEHYFLGLEKQHDWEDLDDYVSDFVVGKKKKEYNRTLKEIEKEWDRYDLSTGRLTKKELKKIKEFREELRRRKKEFLEKLGLQGIYGLNKLHMIKKDEVLPPSRFLLVTRNLLEIADYDTIFHIYMYFLLNLFIYKTGVSYERRDVIMNWSIYATDIHRALDNFAILLEEYREDMGPNRAKKRPEKGRIYRIDPMLHIRKRFEPLVHLSKRPRYIENEEYNIFMYHFMKDTFYFRYFKTWHRFRGVKSSKFIRYLPFVNIDYYKGVRRGSLVGYIKRLVKRKLNFRYLGSREYDNIDYWQNTIDTTELGLLDLYSTYITGPILRHDLYHEKRHTHKRIKIATDFFIKQYLFSMDRHSKKELFDYYLKISQSVYKRRRYSHKVEKYIRDTRSKFNPRIDYGYLYGKSRNLVVERVWSATLQIRDPYVHRHFAADYLLNTQDYNTSVFSNMLNPHIWNQRLNQGVQLLKKGPQMFIDENTISYMLAYRNISPNCTLQDYKHNLGWYNLGYKYDGVRYPYTGLKDDAWWCIRNFLFNILYYPIKINRCSHFVTKHHKFTSNDTLHIIHNLTYLRHFYDYNIEFVIKFIRAHVYDIYKRQLGLLYSTLNIYNYCLKSKSDYRIDLFTYKLYLDNFLKFGNINLPVYRYYVYDKFGRFFNTFKLYMYSLMCISTWIPYWFRFFMKKEGFDQINFILLYKYLYLLEVKNFGRVYADRSDLKINITEVEEKKIIPLRIKYRHLTNTNLLKTYGILGTSYLRYLFTKINCLYKWSASINRISKLNKYIASLFWVKFLDKIRYSFKVIGEYLNCYVYMYQYMQFPMPNVGNPKIIDDLIFNFKKTLYNIKVSRPMFEKYERYKQYVNLPVISFNKKKIMSYLKNVAILEKHIKQAYFKYNVLFYIKPGTYYVQLNKQLNKKRLKRNRLRNYLYITLSGLGLLGSNRFVFDDRKYSYFMPLKYYLNQESPTIRKGFYPYLFSKSSFLKLFEKPPKSIRTHTVKTWLKTAFHVREKTRYFFSRFWYRYLPIDILEIQRYRRFQQELRRLINNRKKLRTNIIFKKLMFNKIMPRVLKEWHKLHVKRPYLREQFEDRVRFFYIMRYKYGITRKRLLSSLYNRFNSPHTIYRAYHLLYFRLDNILFKMGLVPSITYLKNKWDTLFWNISVNSIYNVSHIQKSLIIGDMFYIRETLHSYAVKMRLEMHHENNYFLVYMLWLRLRWWFKREIPRSLGLPSRNAHLNIGRAYIWYWFLFVKKNTFMKRSAKLNNDYFRYHNRYYGFWAHCFIRFREFKTYILINNLDHCVRWYPTALCGFVYREPTGFFTGLHYSFFHRSESGSYGGHLRHTSVYK